jgi:hypothetical protein
LRENTILYKLYAMHPTPLNNMPGHRKSAEESTKCSRKSATVRALVRTDVREGEAQCSSHSRVEIQLLSCDVLGGKYKDLESVGWV